LNKTQDELAKTLLSRNRRIMLKKILIGLSILVLIGMLYFAKQVNQAIPKPKLDKQDIYYSYIEGQRLLILSNPYERVLTGDGLSNLKYATYFPLFYELSALSQILGLTAYPAWIKFWGLIFQGFEVATAILLFATYARRKLEWVGIFAAGFWLFNRWTLKMVATVDLDFIPIFFMLAGLILFSSQRKLSLLLFSISLALKQIAIFIAPILVILIFLEGRHTKDRLLRSLNAMLLIASIPLITSLPFLFWNAPGFINSILFSVTRLAENHFSAPSLGEIVNWSGLVARLPMLLLIFGVYSLNFKGMTKLFISATLIFAIFTNFNSVLYEGYMTWFISLLPVLIIDFLGDGKNDQRAEALPA